MPIAMSCSDLPDQDSLPFSTKLMSPTNMNKTHLKNKVCQFIIT